MERYEYIGQAGSGAYGQVWVCRVRPLPHGEEATDGLQEGMLVACKVFRQAHTDKEIMRLALREVRVLKAINHSNCVRLLDAFKSKSGKVYLIFEYVEGCAYKELCKYRMGLPAKSLKLLAFQLCLSLRYLHGEKIVHRDLKPSNILIDNDGCVKLCDFGFARFTSCTDPRDAERMSSYVVTRWYRAPEVLLSMEYGAASDIWALGCTIAELAVGEPLMPGTSTVDQLWRIMRVFGPLPPHMAVRITEDVRLAALRVPPRGRPLSVRLSGVGPRLIQFLEACLRLDPVARPTADELLRMPYFFEIPHLVAGSSLESLVAQELQPGPIARRQVAAAAAAPPPPMSMAATSVVPIAVVSATKAAAAAAAAAAADASEPASSSRQPSKPMQVEVSTSAAAAAAAAAPQGASRGRDDVGVTPAASVPASASASAAASAAAAAGPRTPGGAEATSLPGGIPLAFQSGAATTAAAADVAGAVAGNAISDGAGSAAAAAARTCKDFPPPPHSPAQPGPRSELQRLPSVAAISPPITPDNATPAVQPPKGAPTASSASSCNPGFSPESSLMPGRSPDDTSESYTACGRSEDGRTGAGADHLCEPARAPEGHRSADAPLEAGRMLTQAISQGHRSADRASNPGGRSLAQLAVAQQAATQAAAAAAGQEPQGQQQPPLPPQAQLPPSEGPSQKSSPGPTHAAESQSEAVYMGEPTFSSVIRKEFAELINSNDPNILALLSSSRGGGGASSGRGGASSRGCGTSSSGRDTSKSGSTSLRAAAAAVLAAAEAAAAAAAAGSTAAATNTCGQDNQPSLHGWVASAGELLTALARAEAEEMGEKPDPSVTAFTLAAHRSSSTSTAIAVPEGERPARVLMNPEELERLQAGEWWALQGEAAGGEPATLPAAATLVRGGEAPATMTHGPSQQNPREHPEAVGEPLEPSLQPQRSLRLNTLPGQPSKHGALPILLPPVGSGSGSGSGSHGSVLRVPRGIPPSMPTCEAEPWKPLPPKTSTAWSPLTSSAPQGVAIATMKAAAAGAPIDGGSGGGSQAMPYPHPQPPLAKQPQPQPPAEQPDLRPTGSWPQPPPSSYAPSQLERHAATATAPSSADQTVVLAAPVVTSDEQREVRRLTLAAAAGAPTNPPPHPPHHQRQQTSHPAQPLRHAVHHRTVVPSTSATNLGAASRHDHLGRPLSGDVTAHAGALAQAGLHPRMSYNGNNSVSYFSGEGTALPGASVVAAAAIQALGAADLLATAEHTGSIAGMTTTHLNTSEFTEVCTPMGAPHLPSCANLIYPHRRPQLTPRLSAYAATLSGNSILTSGTWSPSMAGVAERMDESAALLSGSASGPIPASVQGGEELGGFASAKLAQARPVGRGGNAGGSGIGIHGRMAYGRANTASGAVTVRDCAVAADGGDGGGGDELNDTLELDDDVGSLPNTPVDSGHVRCGGAASTAVNIQSSAPGSGRATYTPVTASAMAAARSLGGFTSPTYTEPQAAAAGGLPSGSRLSSSAPRGPSNSGTAEVAAGFGAAAGIDGTSDGLGGVEGRRSMSGGRGELGSPAFGQVVSKAPGGWPRATGLQKRASRLSSAGTAFAGPVQPPPAVAVAVAVNTAGAVMASSGSMRQNAVPAVDVDSPSSTPGASGSRPRLLNPAAGAAASAAAGGTTSRSGSFRSGTPAAATAAALLAGGGSKREAWDEVRCVRSMGARDQAVGPAAGAPSSAPRASSLGAAAKEGGTSVGSCDSSGRGGTAATAGGGSGFDHGDRGTSGDGTAAPAAGGRGAAASGGGGGGVPSGKTSSLLSRATRKLKRLFSAKGGGGAASGSGGADGSLARGKS